MRNWIRIYSRQSDAHNIAVGSWARDCRSYLGDYCRFCNMNDIEPLSNKQFVHVLKMLDKQINADTRKKPFVEYGFTHEYAGITAR